MKVNIYNPTDDPEGINGFTIVVDVFRAFSMSYYVWENNPSSYLLATSIEDAFALSKQYENSILIGERQGIMIEGFDYGNSPTDIQGKSFIGKTIIHTTTAGTKGVSVQKPTNHVVVGSFVNMGALLKLIRESKLDIVNIYCTGTTVDDSCIEDYLFAEYMKSKLLGQSVDYEEVMTFLRNSSGQKFIKNPVGPYSDFLYCLDVNRFNYVLERQFSNDQVICLNKKS
ncbi:2-phosphosulfolactate phosphatase [Spirochaeta cellobiosiphila]|uniref:2-phosphosulfolactate phosphatase n=1 Tax=Spirochaeta cellobiosiphila TaxID=504483 RepID=UPI0004287C05|nr:2-phosphosulfolactate phosphatase [Spirochaeta cellobiosiphila]